MSQGEEVSQGFTGECPRCGWQGQTHDTQRAAEEEAAEHVGYCSRR